MMRSTVDARSRISNWDLIIDKITNIIADQIDRTLICQVHIGVLTLKLGLGDARPHHSSCAPSNISSSLLTHWLSWSKPPGPLPVDVVLWWSRFLLSKSSQIPTRLSNQDEQPDLGWPICLAMASWLLKLPFPQLGQWGISHEGELNHRVDVENLFMHLMFVQLNLSLQHSKAKLENSPASLWMKELMNHCLAEHLAYPGT